MAVEKFSLLLCTVLFCIFVEHIFASPTRRQNLESSTLSSAGITNEAWDDSDEFDLEGGNWMRTVPPSSQPEYEDYTDDEEEEPQREGEQEFLFESPEDSLREDDDLSPSAVKVRHSGKNLFSESTEDLAENPNDLKEDVPRQQQQQFEFTIDDDEGDEKDDDFILDDSNVKEEDEDEIKDEELPKFKGGSEDDDEASDDNDGEDDPMFESPEEDTQVIYGDHVFLY